MKSPAEAGLGVGWVASVLSQEPVLQNSLDDDCRRHGDQAHAYLQNEGSPPPWRAKRSFILLITNTDAVLQDGIYVSDGTAFRVVCRKKGQRCQSENSILINVFSHIQLGEIGSADESATFTKEEAICPFRGYILDDPLRVQFKPCATGGIPEREEHV